ncbi:hypothetical protein KAT82_09135 [bacterium]|nr:hypothetical protein [bacterium]
MNSLFDRRIDYSYYYTSVRRACGNGSRRPDGGVLCPVAQMVGSVVANGGFVIA